MESRVPRPIWMGDFYIAYRDHGEDEKSTEKGILLESVPGGGREQVSSLEMHFGAVAAEERNSFGRPSGRRPLQRRSTMTYFLRPIWVTYR